MGREEEKKRDAFEKSLVGVMGNAEDAPSTGQRGALQPVFGLNGGMERCPSPYSSLHGP